MIVAGKHGEAVVVKKKRRLRDRELLVERDVFIVAKLCEGRTQCEVARLLNVRQPLVSVRVKRMPPLALEFIRKLVSRHTDDSGICQLPESAMLAASRLVERERHKKLALR